MRTSCLPTCPWPTKPQHLLNRRVPFSRWKSLVRSPAARRRRCACRQPGQGLPVEQRRSEIEALFADLDVMPAVPEPVPAPAKPR